MIKLPQFLSNMFSPTPEPTLNQQAGLTENWQPVESTPIQPGNPTTYAGGNPPGIQPPSMAPYFSGSIPPAMQLQPDTVRTQYGSGSIPSARLMPVGPAGQAGLSSAIQSVVSQQASSGTLITLSMPAQYVVTPGSNISVTWVPVAANLGLFGPSSGVATLPTFRPMVAADEPSTTVNSVTNDTNVHGSITAQNLTLSWSGLLAIARGGTGTATPSLVPGSNITITGSWPNQTISSSGGGIGGVSKIYTNYLASAADNGTLLSFDSSNSSGGSSGGGVTLTLPSPPPSNKWVIFVENIGAGLLVVSPNGLDIDNSPSSLGVTQFQGLAIFTDGVNYFTETGLSEGGGGGGGGTVLSVAMTVPSWLSVSGSPVTSIGTLAVTAAVGQVANKVLATPNGTSGALAVRSLVAADLPSSVVTSVVDGTNVTGTITAQNLTLGWTGQLSVANGGTGTASPGLVAGSNITITGSWPNQTISSSGGSGGGIGGVSYLHASYLAQSSDSGKLLSFDSSSSSSSSLTLTLPNPPPSSTWAVFVENIGIGNLIVSPNGLQLDASSSSLNLSQHQGLVIFTDGSNYFTETGLPEGTSGGAPTTDEYILGSLDTTNLPNSVAIPGLYGGPDVQPASAGSLDDEFAGSSLNTSTRWTWVNQGSASATVANSYLKLTAAAHSGDTLKIITQPVPSTPWAVAAKVSMTFPNSNYGDAGLCLYDGTKVILWCLSYNNGYIIGNFRYTNVTTYSSTPNSFTGPVGGAYMAIEDNGTNLLYSVSFDGIYYQQYVSESRTAFMAGAPTYVGLFADSNNASFPVTLVCDWFRRTL